MLQQPELRPRRPAWKHEIRRHVRRGRYLLRPTGIRHAGRPVNLTVGELHENCASPTPAAKGLSDAEHSAHQRGG